MYIVLCCNGLPPPLTLKRFASEKEGDREVQRTMLELLNQLDGFTSNSDIKVQIVRLVYIPTYSELRSVSIGSS